MATVIDRSKPTKRQSEIVRFITAYTRRWGYSPSYREIMDKFNFASTQGVNCHLVALERKGLILRAKGLGRTIRVVGSENCPHCGKKL
jgi:repressor LexA